MTGGSELTSRSEYADSPSFRSIPDREREATNITQKYYKGDVCPPAEESQVLRAQKFSVFYYYVMNAAFFVYAVFIPLHTKPPYYGGLNICEFKITHARLVLMGIVFALPLIRFVVLSWSDAFYHYGLLLAALEAAVIGFVYAYWSGGLPVLLCLFVSNMLNQVIAQFYWKESLRQTLHEIEELVPPPAKKAKDAPSFFLFEGLTPLYAEWMRLWGFQETRSAATLYDERCGVFGGKGQMSHVKAMAAAYEQAFSPGENQVPWQHAVADLWTISPIGVCDGLLNTFISNATATITGLWLGQAFFCDSFRAEFAVILAASMVILYFYSLLRTTRWLTEGLGVAVAEKEWLVFDVVSHQREREEFLTQVLDKPGMEAEELNKGFRGRLNLTFMWLCVASVADYIGESYLSKLYWNLATETKYMIEALTPYDFRLFAHAKWEVTIVGIFLKMTQNMVLCSACVVFCGTYYPNNMKSVAPFLGFIGVACFVHAILKLLETLQFIFTILGTGGKSTHRHAWVSESIVVIVMQFVLINMVIWLFLLPLMKEWELPGSCNSPFNRLFFPGRCRPM